MRRDAPSSIIPHQRHPRQQTPRGPRSQQHDTSLLSSSPEFYRHRPLSFPSFPHLAPSGKIFLFGFRHVSPSLRSSLSVRTESLPFSDSSERASETRHPPPRPFLRSPLVSRLCAPQSSHAMKHIASRAATTTKTATEQKLKRERRRGEKEDREGE